MSIQAIADSSTFTDLQNDKRNLRRKIRQKRRNLTVKYQRDASRRLATQLHLSKLLLKHKHIALYLGNDGELDPTPLIRQLWRQKKQVYLPVIDPFSSNQLFFCKIQANTPLIKNKFGILEPDFKSAQRIPKQFLSLVLMPLVAFDKHGNRMGMGGGFYDRSFEFKANKRGKPSLIGIAYHFQEQRSLPIEPWDIPLEGILTDQHYFKITT